MEGLYEGGKVARRPSGIPARRASGPGRGATGDLYAVTTIMRRVIADHCETIGAARDALAAARRLYGGFRPKGADDVGAVAYVAACRACWLVLAWRNPRRERLRTQVRCVMTFTPGYAVWAAERSAVWGSRRARTGCTCWLCGRSAWRDAGIAPCQLQSPPLRLPESPRFDEVRNAAFQLIDQSDAPVLLADLLDVLARNSAE